jgi:hypothetical protein
VNGHVDLGTSSLGHTANFLNLAKVRMTLTEVRTVCNVLVNYPSINQGLQLGDAGVEFWFDQPCCVVSVGWRYDGGQ